MNKLEALDLNKNSELEYQKEKIKET